MAEQKRSRPALSDSVKKKRKRERAKMKVHVYLGQHIVDWNCLKERMGFSHDFEVTRYLLEFEKLVAHFADLLLVVFFFNLYFLFT
jgi:hypothetical protein